MNSKDITEIANDIVNIFNKSYPDILSDDKPSSLPAEKEISLPDDKPTSLPAEKEISLPDDKPTSLPAEKEISPLAEKLPTSTEEIMDNLIQMDKEKEEGGVSLDSLVDNLVGGGKNQQIVATVKDISPNLFEGGGLLSSDSSSSDIEIEDRYSDFVSEYKNTILKGGDIEYNREEDLDILPIFPYIVSISSIT